MTTSQDAVQQPMPHVLTTFVTNLPKSLLQLRLAFEADGKNEYNRQQKEST